MNWVTWVFFVGLVWICRGKQYPDDKTSKSKIRTCLDSRDKPFVVLDDFNGVIDSKKYLGTGTCIIFLQREASTPPGLEKEWPQWFQRKLYLSKWLVDKQLSLTVLQGNCSANVSPVDTGPGDACWGRNVSTGTCRQQKSKAYDENRCNSLAGVKDKYIINITSDSTDCFNCNNPVKKPEEQLDHDVLSHLGVTLDVVKGEEVDPAQAAKVMDKMSNLATTINGSSALLTVGEGVTGILVREIEPEDVNEVSFAYVSPEDNMTIIENEDSLTPFARSVTVPKEAFEKSISLNVTVPFVAVLRFTNMAKDEMNSTVLGNEVLAIEMGAMIMNLTDKIAISFRNVTYKGIPSCQSWNGEGGRPNWTSDGCLTIEDVNSITCQCSHLTFFAILMAPLNETISTSDLNTLTIITQVGCGLSMFFLSIVLFMHLLMRKTKASNATRILIHLVLAMFLLNFTFLINNFVAKLKSSVGCQIMAALMHYFMLATFTWFAVQAFHLCMQLHTGGKTVVRLYILKVSVLSWMLPSVVGIVLLIIGKYGEQIIRTNDSEETVSMCWITDGNIHYIVNIGYYALVFLFTFTTFIIILSWLFCLRRTNTGTAQINRSGKSIVTILGLCCMLGITWGFAFFAHGPLQIPAYYIFTVLNSFQGFFLFIYYYNTSHTGELNSGESGQTSLNTSSSTTTCLKTSLDTFNNPYANLPGK